MSVDAQVRCGAFGLNCALMATRGWWKTTRRLAAFFPTMDGTENVVAVGHAGMPPDLLITNYSMLNIMLMRNVEAGISTSRASACQDPGHVFHLVVDELHSYRDTPGTEVAYLLRCSSTVSASRPLRPAPNYCIERALRVETAGEPIRRVLAGILTL